MTLSHINPKRAGFSLLEVMIATAVLGIAMIALVKLHTASIRGLKASRNVGIAEDIATQAAEELAAVPIDLEGQLPGQEGLPTIDNGLAHPCNLAPNPRGCKLDNRTFTAPKPADCTFWVGPTGFARDPLTGGLSYPAINNEALAIADTNEQRSFRIDRIVSPHPDPNALGSIIDIFVCWREESEGTGTVRELHTRRVVGP